MLSFLKSILFGQKVKHAPVLGKYKEELARRRKPVSQDRIPPKENFQQPIDFYIQMHRDYCEVASGAGNAERGDLELAFACRVDSTWGLLYAGADAIPYALELLKSSFADAREDGAMLLGDLGKDDSVIDLIFNAMKDETDSTAKDSMIMALGDLKNRKAIPILTDIITDETEDGDTVWAAIESLGRIVKKPFLKQGDPKNAALEWIKDNPI